MQIDCKILGEYRPLWIEESGRLWVCQGGTVYFSDDQGETMSARAHLPGRGIRTAILSASLAERILRGGFLSLRVLQNGTLIGAVRGGIVACPPDGDRFSLVFQRPGRTLKIEALPDGSILAGEYFYNKQRAPVEIFRSQDGGSTWKTVHRFDAGEVRHVHKLYFDRRRSEILVLTGDTNPESKILRTGDCFRTLQTVSQEGQRSRALVILPSKEGYWVATDTQYDQNYIQQLSFEGELAPRIPIAGSCMSGCQAVGWSFFGTAAEPSPVNRDPAVTLYGTRDGSQWWVIDRWLADRWSWPTVYQAALFQMARLHMPDGENRSGYLFGTPVAVRNRAGMLHRWKVPGGKSE